MLQVITSGMHIVTNLGKTQLLGCRRLVAHLVKSGHKCNPPISESTLKKEIKKIRGK
jgi:Mrp family chromosome partitioning ATPase